MTELLETVPAPLHAHVWSAGSALLIAVLGLLAAAWAGRAARIAAERSQRIDATLVPLLTRLARWSVLLVTLVAVLDRFGVQTSSLLALVGTMGLALGLALKDTVADVAAGIVLLVLRPFDVADSVDIGGVAGDVQAIDLFETKLMSFDGVPIVLPNSRVRGSEIRNFTRASRRRFDLIVGVSYGDDLDRAREVISAALKEDGRVLEDPAPVVNVRTLSSSSVDFLVRYWVQRSDFLDAQLDLTRVLKQRLEREGFSIPFPQHDVHIVKGA